MDLKIIETGDGGDLVLIGNDLQVVQGFTNMPYLALFGGNEQSTPVQRIESEQSFDWWANDVLFPNDQSIQFNSLTEKELLNCTLTSQGRVRLEQAVKKDLEFMRPFAEVTVSVSFAQTDKVYIDIRIQEPDNEQEKKYIYIWDGTKLDLQQ